MMGRVLLLVACALLGAVRLVAQGDTLLGPVRKSELAPVQVDADGTAKLGWLRPFASALVPGSGQLMAGQDRGVVYMALEAVVLVQLLSSRNEAGQERDRYKELAFNVARAPFSPARLDTVFEYFEQVERFVESGPFDTDPGPGLLPPTDESTYNGSVWKLARETFLPDPEVPDTTTQEYQGAVEFYRSHAVGPNFQWSWRDAGLEQDLYRRSIMRSDDAFRRSTQYLGVLLMNHLLSAIDSYVSYRVGQSSAVRLRSSLWRTPGAAGEVAARVGVVVTF
jgi:hypothetical protein